MFGEKDLIFIGAAMLMAVHGVGSDHAVSSSVELYEKVFGRVSDEELRKKYAENNGGN